MGKLTKPVKWHGGKHYLADWILSLAPKDYKHYVEPFFGGGSVLLAREPDGKSEVVNDLHADLTNFWQVLQNPQAFEELQRKLLYTPVSETEFDRALGILKDSRTMTVPRGWRAWAFFVVARQSRQGLMKSWNTLSKTRVRKGMSEQAAAWLGAIDGLPDVHARLQGVVIRCKPALEVIKSEDSPDTWFYLDPPYLHETRTAKGAYANEMSDEQHAELLAALCRIRGKFALSGYPSALYNETAEANGWRCEMVEIDNKAASGASKETKFECVWMNY